METNAVKTYLSYVKETEPPELLHKWCFLSITAAALGRNVWFEFGHIGNIYPNMYVILTGAPAIRKSTAINIAEKLLAKSGYVSFSYRRSTREKFFEDFAEGFNIQTQDESGEFDMAKALEAVNTTGNLSEGHQAFVCHDEIIDFIGRGNVGFVDSLTTLYDTSEKPFTDRIKNSKSIKIPKPVLNILGGTTPSTFANGMPKDIAGSGFLSRLILIFSPPSGRKITIPPPPNAKLELKLIQILSRVLQIRGEIGITDDAYKILDAIYRTYKELPDTRLSYYCARRLTHLIKLSMVCQVLRPDCPEKDIKITTEALVEANTYLHEAESFMPQALGEYADSKFTRATNKVLTMMISRSVPVNVKEMWETASVDLDRMTDLQEVINILISQNKISRVALGSDRTYFKAVIETADTSLIGVDFAKYAPRMIKTKVNKLQLREALKDDLAREIKANIYQPNEEDYMGGHDLL